MKLLLSLTLLLFTAGSIFAQNANNSENSLNSSDNQDYIETTDEKLEPMNIGNLDLEEYIKLYPNPIINVFNLDTEIVKHADVILYDLRGTKVDVFYSDRGETKDMDISHYPKGFYIVHIIADDRIYVQKVLKQ